MPVYYAASIPSSIPDKLSLVIPAGDTITEIDHSCDGAAAVLLLEIGSTNQITEASNLALSKVATTKNGGHQSWSGAWVCDRDYYVKAWLRSVVSGGSHNVVVKTTSGPGGGGGGQRSSSAFLRFAAKGPVQTVTFSKGLTVDLDAPVGHDLEIVGFEAVSTNDGTVATRALSLASTTGANGAGTRTLKPLNFTSVASDVKVYAGGLNNVGGTYTGVFDWHEWIIPAGGSIKATETNYVAGDAWSIIVTYRDIPVNLFV